MRALPQHAVGSSSQRSAMLASRPLAAPVALRTSLRRPSNTTPPASAPAAPSQRQRCLSVVTKAGGLGGFVQGLAAKLTGARNADDATPSGAYTMLDDERAVLIDIRPKGEVGKAGSPDLREYKGKRIISMPYDYEVPEQFVAKYLKLSAVDDDSLVLLLDSDGSDAPAAAAALAAEKQARGQKFYPVRGGAVAWQEADLPWRAGGLVLPGLALPALPSNLDQLAEEFKANPSIGSAALSLAAIVGSATFIISEFDVILEVAGVLGVSVFSIKNLLYAEDREKLLRRMSLFLKEEVGAEAASEELKKLAERALASAENKASNSSSGSGSVGAEVSNWISGWRTKQQEVTEGVQKAMAAAADSAKQRAEESDKRRQAAAAAALAPPVPTVSAPAAPVAAARAPAAAPAAAAPVAAAPAKPPAKRMQSVQEAREWIVEWNAKREQQAKEAAAQAAAAEAAEQDEPAAEAAVTPAAEAAVTPAAEAAATPAAPAADIEQANVREAREWISAWAAKQGQQAAEEAPVEDMAKQQQKAAAPEAVAVESLAPARVFQAQVEVPANVQDARDWISQWQVKQLQEQAVQLAAPVASVKVEEQASTEAANESNGNGQAKQEGAAAKGKEGVREKEAVTA